MTILIGGGSCSGKSTLARELSGQTGWPLTHLDTFFRRGQPGAPMIEVGGELLFDCNHPDTIDWDAAMKAVGTVSGSQIVEGHFALTSPSLRKIADLKVFVDCPAEVRKVRRIERDSPARGSREQVLDYYQTCAVPGYALYIEPSRQYADTVLDGTLDPHLLVDQILALLNS